MPKIRVIKPVYKVEQFIERCAISLFEQTLDDIEYLFIDDCSPDNSVEIIKNVLMRYETRKDSVRIISMQKNCGQAAVRRYGNSIARGDYIIHCDGDDWVDINMYYKMYECAVNNKLDIVRCKFCRTDGKLMKECINIPSNIYCDAKKMISYLLRLSDLSSTCDKLVRRELYQSVDFIYPVDNMCEDFAIVTQLFCRTDKIGYIDEVLYFYYQNKFSISHILDNTHIDNKAQQISNNVKLIGKILKTKYPGGIFDKEIEVIKLMAKNAYRPIIRREGYYEKWKTLYKEINSKIFFNEYITIKEKLSFIACYIGIYPLLTGRK